MEDLNILELIKRFRKYIVLVLITAVVGAVVVGLGVNTFVAKEYQSEAQLLVNQRSAQEDVQVGDIQTNVMLVNTYQDILLAQSVLVDVNERLGNHFSVDELRDSISVNQLDNSQTFFVTSTMNSPTDAQNVVSTLVDVFIEVVEEVYEGELSGIYLLSPATYSESPVSPSIPRFAFIGFIVGAFLGVIYALIRELSDTTVKDDEIFIRAGLNKLGEVYELNTREVNRARKKMGTNNKKSEKPEQVQTTRVQQKTASTKGTEVESSEETTKLRRDKV